jgi:hypothetical protein
MGFECSRAVRIFKSNARVNFGYVKAVTTL